MGKKKSRSWIGGKSSRAAYGPSSARRTKRPRVRALAITSAAASSCAAASPSASGPSETTTYPPWDGEGTYVLEDKIVYQPFIDLEEYKHLDCYGVTTDIASGAYLPVVAT